MRTFLVTGGAGFIGSHIATALVRRGDRVRVLDDLSTGSRENLVEILDGVELLEGDVADAETVARAMVDVDCVFHQAALASVPMSIESPLETNRVCVDGTVNILDQARRAGVRRVVYAASSSLYGDRPTASKRETDLPEPLSPYAAAKLAGEYYCWAFARSFDLQTVCLRYFNVFGPRQDPDSPYSAVIPLFLTALLAGRRPVVYGDGRQSRDFTYVDNIVHGNLLAADADADVINGKSFNIADGAATDLLTLLRILNEQLGLETQPQFEPPRVGDVKTSLADITDANLHLGYEPQVSFEDGLRRSIDYYRQLVERSKKESGR